MLTGQIERWRAAADLDAYLTAVTAVVEGLDDPGGAGRGRAWLDWAGREQAHRDPLRAPIAMPVPPVPPDEDLAPFLLGTGIGARSRRRR